MGFFRRSPTSPVPDFNDPTLDDDSWLRAGESRFNSLISNHYGSPDTVAAGGDLRLQQDDLASALFFFQKSVDTLHSIYVCGFNDTGPGSWNRQPSPRDESIVDRYVRTLESIRQVRPGAPVKDSVVEVTHRLRTISSQFQRYGLNAQPYLEQLERLGRLAPDVDVSGVFWS